MRHSTHIGLIIGVIGLGSSVARAQDAAPTKPTQQKKLGLTPHLGVTSESDFVNGAVRFSDGAVDYLLIDPDAGLQVGVELDYAFRPKLAGVLGISYASADARYIEDNNFRPDARMSSIRVQPGLMVGLIQSGKIGLSAGGGLTLARVAVDRIVWNGFRIAPTSVALGLFGAGGLDVALSARLSLHAHVALEVSRPSYGDLEADLAMADNELASEVDHDTRSALVGAVGLRIGL